MKGIQIIQKIEELLQTQITSTDIPNQGMDSEVFFITDDKKNEYAVKMTKNGMNDVIALNLIKDHNITIPVPKIIAHFTYENKTVVILEKLQSPLLDTIPIKKRVNYIPSMIHHLKKLHKIQSQHVGWLMDPEPVDSWKELLLHKYSNNHRWFKWEETLQRDRVDKALVQQSIEKIVTEIENTSFNLERYSLLHTDFNQGNLFVDSKSNEIIGIIDWSDAMFGDPLYDFARVRMFMWHFNLDNQIFDLYHELLKLNKEEKKVEKLYFVSQIIDYITWYSEVKNDFTDSRLKLHQEFLKQYN